MFRKLKDAYSNLVAAINGHTDTIKQADRKVRDFYGLDDPDVNLLPPAEPPPAEEKTPPDKPSRRPRHR